MEISGLNPNRKREARFLCPFPRLAVVERRGRGARSEIHDSFNINRAMSVIQRMPATGHDQIRITRLKTGCSPANP
jgi:hypothetical protein